MNQIQVIAFDADDTLWVNEPYFRETEDRFCELLEDYLPHHSVARELLHTEIKNLDLYGYGVKGFMLSMIETAMEVSNKTVPVEIIEKCVLLGKELLNKPIVMLEGVEEVLAALKGKYKLVVATKGDLLDQERKLMKSGLSHYFHHIEIMSEKKEGDYQKLFKHLDIHPESFMMLGNSLKSDVIPVLALNAYAVHIPYHTTWAHETVDADIKHPHFRQVNEIKEVLSFLL